MVNRSPMACLLFAAAAVLLLLAADGAMAAGATHKVGGLDAWGIPPASKPDVYVRWGNSTKVSLGDALMFLYPPSQDNAVQVTAKAFAACDVSKPLAKLDDGNSVFNLTAPGRAYFTSAAPGHCRKGQKVSVDVPRADGSLVKPSADDLAALKVLQTLPPAAAPSDSLPALSPVDGDEDSSSAAVTRASAAAAGFVASVSSAALFFALVL